MSILKKSVVVCSAQIVQKSKSVTRPVLVALALILSLTGCQKDFSDASSETQELANANVLSNSLTSIESTSDNGITVTEITFTAIAMIAYCHGENIRFTGIIENRVKKSVNANGEVHFIRHFTVKGMTGVGLTTGTIYDVVGGAEMFSIKDAVFNADGSLNLSGSLSESDIVIHRGILIFVSRTDGTRVVARHDIQKVPGAGILQNRWLCAGN